MSIIFRKYINLFILIIVSYQAMGAYVFYFGWKLYMAEKMEEIANSLPSENLIKISKYFDGNILKEFEENNKMYDVIRYAIEADTINYYCINDMNEEQINAQLKDDSTLDSFKKKCCNKAKIILKKITEQVIAILSFKPFYTIKSIEIIKLTFIPKLILFYINTTTPPPKF